MANLLKDTNRLPIGPFNILIILASIFLLLIGVLGALIGIPFKIWYWDCAGLLLTVGIILLFFGGVWDGIIVGTWFLSKILSKSIITHKSTPLKIIWNSIGFFSFGLRPFPIIILTSYIILETSNITAISLKLTGFLFPWKDTYFWSIEKAVFYFLSDWKPNTFFWDVLYNSAWIIEVSTVFLLIILSRNMRTITKFCFSFILLFYIGRLLGLLNPVKGPAFYKPELFLYLEGTTSAKLMERISQIMAADPLSLRSGVLIGGVSAMPSLHIGMVFLTSYWLSVNVRIMRFITPFWVILVWISTVLLGWHYIIDGFGGILLAITCILLTRVLFKYFEGDRGN
jgi:membrane-associated phospholipid phosphatase